MIDRELTEALDWSDEFLAQAQGGASLARIRTIIEAGPRLLLDFPTDEQVEAAAEAIFHERFPRAQWGEGTSKRHIYLGDARAALAAVRDTMIGASSVRRNLESPAPNPSLDSEDWICRNTGGDTICTNQEEADEMDRIWNISAPHADCGPTMIGTTDD